MKSVARHCFTFSFSRFSEVAFAQLLRDAQSGTFTQTVIDFYLQAADPPGVQAADPQGVKVGKPAAVQAVSFQAAELEALRMVSVLAAAVQEDQ